MPPDPTPLELEKKMTDRKVLVELLAKVEAATRPDRELDFAVWDCLFPPAPLDQSRVTHRVTLPPGFGRDAFSQAMDPRPKISASIDAALALVERLLPDARWRIEHHSPVMGHRPFWAMCGMAGQQEAAYGDSAPSAILAALLRALLAQSEPVTA